MGGTVLDLKHFARQCLAKMRQRIVNGEEVAPMAFVLVPEGEIIAAPINFPTDVLRAEALRKLVAATEARALLMVSDAWKKDPANPRIRVGEMLSAILVTRDDPDTVIGYVQEYERQPFRWKPIEELDGVGGFAHDVFPRRRVH